MNKKNVGGWSGKKKNLKKGEKKTKQVRENFVKPG
jgi:hypothetical protein